MGMPAPITPIHRTALADEITTLYAHINAATCRLIELIGAFDELGYYADFGALSTAHWLSWACGIGAAAAREKVRVARALEQLPEIHAAFREGRLSYSKVRALTRVASPANESTLIDLAGHATAAQTERIVRNYRQSLTLEGPAPGRPDRALICQWDGTGALLIRGRLAPEQGAVFLKALEQALEQIPKPIGNDVWDRQQDYHVDLRRADALVVLSERSLNAGRADASPAERFQVVVSVSAETLAADAMTTKPGADLPLIDGGPAISAERARRLCCDGSVVPVLESASGEILNIGRKTRTIPPALRRALKRRDQHCRFPGCVHTRHLHGHHLIHWAHGGETSLANTLLLCSRHHRLVHEGGYSIRRVTSDSGTTFEFRDSQGSAVPRADDLRRGDWQQLVDDVSAETPGLHAGILKPDLDWRLPDYDHIAWWMVNFMGR